MTSPRAQTSSRAARAVRWMLGGLSRMPRKTNERLAHALGRLWHALDTHHREIALRNLDLAYGSQMTEEERKETCRRVFVHLARVFLEVPYLCAIHKDNVHEYMTFTGIEHAHAALSKKKGVLVLGSHFGNWEMMSLGFSLSHHPFHVVVRPLDNPVIDQVMEELRCRGGNGIIHKKGSVKTTLKVIRNRGAVAFLMDQSVDWYDGVFVPFFGRTTCTSKALAVLALRTGAPVVPVHNIRRTDGRYEVIVGPEIPMVRTGDQTRDIEENTAQLNKILEDQIRTHPEQWFWVHRRWKVRPHQPWPRQGM